MTEWFVWCRVCCWQWITLSQLLEAVTTQSVMSTLLSVRMAQLITTTLSPRQPCLEFDLSSLTRTLLTLWSVIWLCRLLVGQWLILPAPGVNRPKKDESSSSSDPRRYQLQDPLRPAVTPDKKTRWTATGSGSSSRKLTRCRRRR